MLRCTMRFLNWLKLSTARREWRTVLLVRQSCLEIAAANSYKYGTWYTISTGVECRRTRTYDRQIYEDI